MARWWLLAANIRRVTVSALTALLVLLELFLDRDYLRVRDLLVVTVASHAGGHRHVWRQSSERRSPRDIDMAGRALQSMFAFAAGMVELCGNPFRPIVVDKGRRTSVASGTVI